MYTWKNEELSDWRQLAKCQLKIKMLPLVSHEMPSRALEVLRVTLPQAWTVQAMEVDDNGHVDTREEDSSTGFTLVATRFALEH